MKPGHLMEGNLLYSTSTNLNVKNTFTATPRVMFDQMSGHYGPAKLTHKMNHYRCINQIKILDLQNWKQVLKTQQPHQVTVLMGNIS